MLVSLIIDLCRVLVVLSRLVEKVELEQASLYVFLILFYFVTSLLLLLLQSAWPSRLLLLLLASAAS